jgi:serine/threonine protein kinase/Tfp pilus assembly protein PilF
MIDKILGHYKILEEIGRGGMGIVYKAEDTKLKRTVALKFLPPQLSSDPETKERFIHEAQAASALDHPNICTIYEISESGAGESYIAMACYDGQSLKLKIENCRLKIDESINIAIQIAQGLQKAHEKGIVHRDIKPANIMITNDGTAKILDFGLAKLAGQTRLTKTGSTVGTAAYMSPEQAKGEPVDQRTDIWSLGVVMYEMLSGKLPFEADYEQAMIYSIINEDPVPVSNLNEDVSAELKAMVHRCLAKNGKERYQTIDDLLLDFKSFSKKINISFDESLPKLIGRFWRKKFVRRIMLLASAIVLVGVMYLLFWPKLIEPIPIAVISFENQTGDEGNNRLSKIIPNLLITALEQSGRFQVVTLERLRDLLKQTGKDSIDYIDSDIGFELCQMEGINNLALGTIVKMGEIIVTDLKILDVESKGIVHTAQSRGEGENSIMGQIDELTKEIASKLGGLTEEEFTESHRSIEDITTNSPEAYNYYILGRENLDAYLFEEARNNLTKAVRLDSTFAMAHIYLAYAYHWVWEFPAEFDTFLEMAKKNRNKATHKDQILLDYDYAYMKGLDQSKSARALTEAIPLNPKEKQIFGRLAQFHRSKGDIDSAIVFYKKVLDLDPTDKRTLNNIGYMYVKNREYSIAINYFQKCADISPLDANPYDSMGEVYLMMNDYSKSIEMYQKAFNLNPTGYHYTLLSLNYIKMGKYQKARNHLNQWYKKGSSYSDRMGIQKFIAISYLADGDLKNTLREMEKWVILAKQASDTVEIIRYHFTLSEILYKSGDLKKAEGNLLIGNDILNRANIDPRYQDELKRKYLWHLTRLAVKNGDIEKAKIYAEKYKSYDLNKYLALSGLIAYVEEKYKKAISELTQSKMDDTFTNYYLALAYIKTSDNMKAIDRLERVIDYNDAKWIQNELFRYHAKKQLEILKAGN